MTSEPASTFFRDYAWRSCPMMMWMSCHWERNSVDLAKKAVGEAIPVPMTSHALPRRSRDLLRRRTKLSFVTRVGRASSFRKRPVLMGNQVGCGESLNLIFSSTRHDGVFWRIEIQKRPVSSFSAKRGIVALTLSGNRLRLQAVPFPETANTLLTHPDSFRIVRVLHCVAP